MLCSVIFPSLLNNHRELSVTVHGNLSHLPGCQHSVTGSLINTHKLVGEQLSIPRPVTNVAVLG